MPIDTYRTVQGDSFDAVAYRLWEDERLAAALIAANPDYADVLLFEAGVTLNIPNVEPLPRRVTALPGWAVAEGA